jgi:glucose-1-phosphate thymidylyltransferase
LKVACPEEIAYKMEFISRDEFENLINSIPKSLYRDYLEKLLKESDGNY